MMDFKQAEKKFKQLKVQFETGALTENAFKAKLEELMVQDKGGDWWMIGYETEQWYRNVGTDWVQADPPGSPSEKPKSIPSWITILWITLGWAIIRPIGWPISDALMGAFGDEIGWVLFTAFFGAIGGFVTSLALWSEGVLSDRKNILWITLGWAIAEPIGVRILDVILNTIGVPGFELLFGAIFGTIGGLITSILFWKESALSDWKDIIWVTLGWAIGWGIGRTVNEAIGDPFGEVIGGAIGGFVMIWQLRKVEENDGISTGGEKVQTT
jgi:hypothetical protein